MTKHEIELLLRALRANLTAARSGIGALEPKLRAQFENELNRFYPLNIDPVWQEQFELLHKPGKAVRLKLTPGVTSSVSRGGSARAFDNRSGNVAGSI
jgi:hypothetical protein